jgi:hypothetical protein
VKATTLTEKSLYRTGGSSAMMLAIRTMEEAPKGKIEYVDLEGLSGVEAIIATLKRVEKLSPEERLVVTLGSMPYQLYDLVQQRGCTIKYEQQGGKITGIIQRKQAVTVRV